MEHSSKTLFVEREVDTIAATVLGLYDTGENRHVRVLLFQRRDLSQRLAGLRQAPVLLQVTPVQQHPFSNEAKRCSRLDGTGDQFTAEVELAPCSPWCSA